MSSVPAYRRGSLLRRAVVGLVAMVVGVSASAWLLHATIEPDAESAAAPEAAANGTALAGVKTWGYQLQHLDIAQAAGSNLDLMVVDPSAIDMPAEIAPGQGLAELRRKPDGSRRMVFAYLSIGEAEEFRPYWRREWVSLPADAPAVARTPSPAAPAWLASENPGWRGNYRVRFWVEGWQSLMFGTPEAAVDRIIAAGFDGVYLDRADVYAAFKKERANAAADMVAFITHLADYARAHAPGFLVILQNAEELLQHAPLRQTIDAVVKEDLLFGLRQPGAENSGADITASLSYLTLARHAGRPVFVIEYLDDAAKAAVARRRLAELGFIPYFAPRDLGRLNLEF